MTFQEGTPTPPPTPSPSQHPEAALTLTLEPRSVTTTGNGKLGPACHFGGRSPTLGPVLLGAHGEPHKHPI